MTALSPLDPCQSVICMFSSQSGKTEIILNFIGYIIAEDPGPTLAVQPNQKPMAEAFSKDRIAPLIRDTPAVRGRLGNDGERKSGNTILHKSFPGGHITIGGANSPAGLASRPIRYLLCDELDRWEVTKEGDSFSLAKKRTQTFWNRKILCVSSPTYEDVGIHAQYEQTRKHEWQFQCLHCDEKQRPQFRHFNFERDESGAPINITYTCEQCGVLHTEADEDRLKLGGSWVCQNPEASELAKGYWFNQWGSPFARWHETIGEFLEKKDSPETLQVVTNTAFCETWKGSGVTNDWELLKQRREVYPHDDTGLIVPAGVSALFLCVDTQDSYLDYEVIGANERLESWGIEKGQLYGDTDQSMVYQQLDELLDRRWRHETGHEMEIHACSIDIKGHRQKFVKAWVHKRRARRVFGFAGLGQGARQQILRTKQKLDDSSRRKVKIWNIRVDDFKRLAIDYMGRNDPGDYALCHWPRSRHFDDVAGYDAEYFQQLCAERLVTKKIRGFESQAFEKTRARNEAFDLRHNFYALLQVSNPPWSRLQLKPKSPPPQRNASAEIPAEQVQRRRPAPGRRSGWMRR